MCTATGLPCPCSTLTGPGYRPSLEKPLLPAGLGLVSENNIVVVFRGTAIGKTTITATVSISSKIEGREQYQVDRDKTITISTSSLWWIGWRFST